MDLFLTQNNLRSNNNATHLMLMTKEKYNITSDFIQDMWVNYCDDVYNNKQLHFAEIIKPDDNIPLHFDIKFTYNRTKFINTLNGDKFIKDVDNYICKIISIIQLILIKTYEISDTQHELLAIYMRHKIDDQILIFKDNVEFNAKLYFPLKNLIDKSSGNQ